MIVYTYKAKPPRVGLEDAELQFRLRLQYKNDLIGIERRRRQMDEAAQQSVCPALAAAAKAARQAEAEVEALVQTMAAQRAKTRRRAADAPEGLAEAKARRKAAWEAEAAAAGPVRGPVRPPAEGCLGGAAPQGRRKKKAKAGFHAFGWDQGKGLFVCAQCSHAAPPAVPPGEKWSELSELRALMHQATLAAQRAAREKASKAGLYWANYQRADEAVQRMAGPELPRFRQPSFDEDGDEDGETAIHPANGGKVVTVAQVLQGTTEVWLQRCSYEEYLGPELLARRAAAGRPTVAPHRGGARGRAPVKEYALCHLRVGSEGRAPRWLVLPICLHRPLPPGAILKWAWARRFRGRWSVQFVLDARPAARSESRAAGRVAIDLSWRPVQGGIRVAFWVDDQGKSGQVLCPDSVIERLRKADGSRATADKEFDLARGVVGKFLATIDEWPDWLRLSGAEHLAKWKSPRRLSHLITLLRQHRLPGDESLLATLDRWYPAHERPHGAGPVSWERQARHLREDCDRGARSKSERTRRELYNRFAAWIARTYQEEVVLENLVLTDFATRRPTPEQGAQTEDAALRRLRTLAAPSLLRLAVVNAVEREGGKITKLPAAFTSRDCPDCGHRNPPSTDLLVVCENCGVMEDCDKRAGRNLLAAAATTPGAQVPAAGRDLVEVVEESSAVV